MGDELDLRTLQRAYDAMVRDHQALQRDYDDLFAERESARSEVVELKQRVKRLEAKLSPTEIEDPDTLYTRKQVAGMSDEEYGRSRDAIRKARKDGRYRGGMNVIRGYK